jgi:hypothetical protein
VREDTVRREVPSWFLVFAFPDEARIGPSKLQPQRITKLRQQVQRDFAGVQLLGLAESPI